MSRNSSSAVLSDCTNTSIHKSLLGNSLLKSSKLSIENETFLQDCSNVSLSCIRGEKTFIGRVRETLEISGIEEHFPVGTLNNVKVKKKEKTKHNLEISTDVPSLSDFSEQLTINSLLGPSNTEESNSSVYKDLDAKLESGKKIGTKYSLRNVSVTLNSDCSMESVDKSCLDIIHSKQCINERYCSQDDSDISIGSEGRQQRRTRNSNKTNVSFDISRKEDSSYSIDESTLDSIRTRNSVCFTPNSSVISSKESITDMRSPKIQAVQVEFNTSEIFPFESPKAYKTLLHQNNSIRIEETVANENSKHCNADETNRLSLTLDNNCDLNRNTGLNREAVDSNMLVDDCSFKNILGGRRVSVQFALDNSDGGDSSRRQSRKSIRRKSIKKSVGHQESSLLEISERNEPETTNFSIGNSTECNVEKYEIAAGHEQTDIAIDKNDNHKCEDDIETSGTSLNPAFSGEDSDRPAKGKSFVLNSSEMDCTTVTNEMTVGSEVDITCANTSASSKLAEGVISPYSNLNRNTGLNREAVDSNKLVEDCSFKNIPGARRVSVQFALDNSDGGDSSRRQSRKSIGRQSIKKSVEHQESCLLEISERNEPETTNCSIGNSSECNVEKYEIVAGHEQTEIGVDKNDNHECEDDMETSGTSLSPAFSGEDSDRPAKGKSSVLNSSEIDCTTVTNEMTVGREVDITCANTSASSKLAEGVISPYSNLNSNTGLNREALDSNKLVDDCSFKNIPGARRVSVQFALDNSDGGDSSSRQSRKSIGHKSIRKSVGVQEACVLEVRENNEHETINCSIGNSSECIADKYEIAAGNKQTDIVVDKNDIHECEDDMETSGTSLRPAFSGEETIRPEKGKSSVLNSREIDCKTVTNEMTVGSEVDITFVNTPASSKLPEGESSPYSSLKKNFRFNREAVDSNKVVNEFVLNNVPCNTNLLVPGVVEGSISTPHMSVQFEDPTYFSPSFEEDLNYSEDNNEISSDECLIGKKLHHVCPTELEEGSPIIGGFSEIYPSETLKETSGKKCKEVQEVQRGRGSDIVGILNVSLPKVEDLLEKKAPRNVSVHIRFDDTSHPLVLGNSTHNNENTIINLDKSSTRLQVSEGEVRMGSSSESKDECILKRMVRDVSVHIGFDTTTYPSNHESTSSDFLCNRNASSCLKKTSTITLVPDVSESLDTLDTISLREERFAQKIAPKNVSVPIGFDTTTYSSKLENTVTDFFCNRYSSNSFKETPSTTLSPAISESQDNLDTIISKEGSFVQMMASKNVSVHFGFDSTTSSKLEKSKTGDNCSNTGFKGTVPFDSQLTSLQSERFHGLMLSEPKDESFSKEKTSTHDSTPHHSVLPSSLAVDIPNKYPNNKLIETLLTSSTSKELLLTPSKIVICSSSADAKLDSKVVRDSKISQKHPHLDNDGASQPAKLDTEKTMPNECSVLTEKCLKEGPLSIPLMENVPIESSDCPSADTLPQKSISKESDSRNISSNTKFDSKRCSVTSDKSSATKHRESYKNYVTNTVTDDGEIILVENVCSITVETKGSMSTKKPYVSTTELNENIDSKENVSTTECVLASSSELSKMATVEKTGLINPERNFSPLSFNLSIGSLTGETLESEEHGDKANSPVNDDLVTVNSEHLEQNENCEESSISLGKKVLTEKQLAIESHNSTNYTSTLLISNANSETFNHELGGESMNWNLQKELPFQMNDLSEESNSAMNSAMDDESSNFTTTNLPLKEANKISLRKSIKNIETQENNTQMNNGTSEGISKSIASEEPLNRPDKTSPLVTESLDKKTNNIISKNEFFQNRCLSTDKNSEISANEGKKGNTILKSTSTIGNENSKLTNEKYINEPSKSFQYRNDSIELLISQDRQSSESNTVCKDNVIEEKNTNLEIPYLVKNISFEESLELRPSHPREYLSTSCDPLLPINVSLKNSSNEDNSYLLVAVSVPNETLPSTSKCNIELSNNSIFDVSLPKDRRNFGNESINKLSSKCDSDVTATKHKSNDKRKLLNSEITEEGEESTDVILSNLRRSKRCKKSSLVKSDFEEQKKENRKSVTFAAVTLEKNISPRITDVDSPPEEFKRSKVNKIATGNAYLQNKGGDHSVERNISSTRDVFACPKVPSLKSINSNHESRNKRRKSESLLSLESINRSKRKESSDKTIDDLSNDTIDVSEISRDKIMAPKKIIYHSTPINPVLEKRKKSKIISRSNIMNSNSPSNSDKNIQVSKSIFGSFSGIEKRKSSDFPTPYSHRGESSSQAKRKSNDMTATHSKRLRGMQGHPLKVICNQSSDYSKSKRHSPSDDLSKIMHSAFSNQSETASIQTYASPGTLSVSKYNVKFRQKVQFRDFLSQTDSSINIGSSYSKPRSDDSDSMFSPPTSSFASVSRTDCSKQVNFRDHLSFIQKSSSTITPPSLNKESVNTKSEYSETQPSTDENRQWHKTNSSSFSISSPRFKMNKNQLTLHNLYKKNNHLENLNAVEASFINSEDQDITLSSIGKQSTVSEIPTLPNECFDILAERIRNTSINNLELRLPSLKKTHKIDNYEREHIPRFFTDGKPYSFSRVKLPAKWVSLDLYKYCYEKLKTYYNEEASAMSERLVAHICCTVASVKNLNEPNDIELATLVLRNLLCKYKICTNILEYSTLICKYTPHDFQRKVLPIDGYFNSLPIKNMKKLSDPIINMANNINVTLH